MGAVEAEEGVRPGLTGEASLVVGESDTAEAVGSGAVAVLGTPVLVALVERAAVAALASALPPGQTSVGTVIELRHTAPTPPGLSVTARAELTAVEGRRLRFRVTAWDEIEQVAEGWHIRVIVDQERFLHRALAKGTNRRSAER